MSFTMNMNTTALALTPLVPLTATNLALSQQPKTSRSYSVSSLLSTTSSTSTSSVYSRAPEDLLDRLAAQGSGSTFHLWSAGNVRLAAGLDLTVPARDSRELIDAIRFDERFEVVSLVYLDEHEGDDWKITFRRTDVTSSSALSTPPLSDTE